MVGDEVVSKKGSILGLKDRLYTIKTQKAQMNGQRLVPYKRQNKEKETMKWDFLGFQQREGQRKQRADGKRNKNKEGQRSIELKQESRLTPYPCKTRCREVGSIRR